MDIRKTLSNNIKQRRAILNLSQEELAFKCDLHRTYISDVERCQRNISIDNIERIAIALNISPSALLKEN